MMESVVAIFGIILTALGTIILMYFKDMKDSVQTMSKNMIELNMKLERVITDQSWHKEEMIEIKSRLAQLEKEK